MQVMSSNQCCSSMEFIIYPTSLLLFVFIQSACSFCVFYFVYQQSRLSRYYTRQELNHMSEYFSSLLS